MKRNFMIQKGNLKIIQNNCYFSLMNIVKVVYIIIILAGFFFIPLFLQEFSSYFLKQSGKYWVLLNENFISRLIGWIGAAIFIYIIVRISAKEEKRKA